MTIKNKLLACLGLLALTTFLLIGGFYNSSSHSKAALETVLNDRVEPLRQLKTVADGYAVSIVDSAHKARNGNISFAEATSRIEHGSADLHLAWKRYRATRIEGDEEQLAEKAEQRMQTSDGEVARLVQILRQGDRAALDRFVVGDLYPAIDPVSDAMNNLVNLQIKVASDDTTEALNRAGTLLIVMIGFAAAALAVLGASFFIITRKVVAPIKTLATLITGLAKQSGSVQLPNLDQKDEIGDITRSVDAFLAAAVAKERERAEAEAATQALVTNSLAEGLTAMADGDLTHAVTADFPAAYLPLKTNFNQALNALSTLVAAVGEGARSIRGGSGEIAQAADDLARRTESNAASLEETSAAIVEMERRLRAGAEAAKRTVERADGAIATVSSGRTTADEAVGAMGRVSESAKGIDGVIEGLDKIAFQTRVLAMNAAVEAGRAGDAGKGFAVVADLVSALAMRAEEEAKRARDQLTVTQAEIGTAVEAVQKVDGALANISGDVGEVHQLLGSIAEDNQAQSASITQISAAITAMDQATQQNAAMVEETSAAVRNLTAEVATLADQAASFNVGDGGAPARARATSVPSAFTAAPKKLPAAAVAALTRKGDEDGWTEF